MWWKILYRWAVGAGEVWYGLAPMMIWYGMVWYHTHKQTGPQLRKGMTPLRSSQAVEDELVLILAFAHCRRIPGSSCPAHSHHGQPAHTMGQPAHTMGQPAHTRSHHGCSHMGQPAHTWASPLTPWASPLTHGMGQPAHTPNNNSRRGCRLVSVTGRYVTCSLNVSTHVSSTLLPILVTQAGSTVQRISFISLQRMLGNG